MIGECTSRGGRSLTMVFSASVDVAFRVLGALGFNVGALIIRIGFPLKGPIRVTMRDTIRVL